MSFVAFAATVGGGSALLGGAMIGAGIGGAYSAISGDGDVLNSMLTGGLIGGAGAYGLGAMGVGAGGATGVGSAGAAGSFGTLSAAPTAGTFGALSAGAAPGAATGSALTSGLGVGTGSALAGTGSAAAVGSAVPVSSTLTPTASSILGATKGGSAVAGLTGPQMLGYGLAGSSALSLLGNQSRTSAGGSKEEDEYTKRLKGYRLSPDYQPYRAQQPSSYYRPTYAADGGVMNSYDDEAGMDMAGGGMTSLGGYSDGGRMLKGPGDGMSDSIPGVIGGKQPARLADGEFVVPADVVSHLGNGSTDAGAKRLYSMMDDIRKARTGRKKQAPEINADKYLPMNKKASGGIASIPGYASGGVIGYAEGGTTYSDAQVAQAVAESMAQGFSLAESLQGGMQNYGISQAQADRAAAVVGAYETGLGRAPDPAGAAYWASTGMSGADIAAAIANSPEANSNRSPTSPNTSGGTYADKEFSDAAVASYLAGHNATTQAEISQIQNAFGITSAQIARAQELIARNDPSIGEANRLYAEAIAARPEAVKENADAVVTQIFTQQLGRAPDAAGLQYWSNLYQNGGNTQAIVAGISQSKEGQDMDIQGATSAYRQALGRNPEPEGMQYWLSVAQNEGLSSRQLQDRITAAASAEQTARNILPGTKFTQMELDALGANPYAGYYSEKSIYDIAPDALNVSRIGDRQVQFTTPVTQQAVVSQFVDGIYTSKQGLDMLNTPHALAAINVAVANGTLKKSDYDRLVTDLDNAKTAAEVRSALLKPQGQVVIDAAYGQQIGEAATLAEAQREAAQRQAVLTGMDPGYYLSNRTLTDAYQKAGVSIPFQYDFYKGVDTRDRESVKVTPENFLAKKNELANATRSNIYRPQYDPLDRGIGNMPASVRDPYSDEGLKVLYGQMMDQYGVPTPGLPNPAAIPTDPYTYKPPVPQRITDEQNARAAYDAKVAADRLAYPTSPITQSNFDATAYLKNNPDVANNAMYGSQPYQHYLDYGKNEPFRVIDRLPFTPAPFTMPTLIPNAAAPAPAPVVADAAAPVVNKAGGLMAINRKKQAKTKPRKGLLAA
jgi:hypothetical protein